MPTEEFDYNGRHVVIGTEGDNRTLMIDGEPIPFHYSAGGDDYVAVHHAPHISHSSLEDLAKYLVDQVINRRPV